MFWPVLTFKFHNLWTDLKTLARVVVLLALSAIDIIWSALTFWTIVGGLSVKIATARATLLSEAVEDFGAEAQRAQALADLFAEKMRTLRH